MKWFVVFILMTPVSGLLALSLSEAESNPENRVIVCERPESLGLYKQCFEGTILERVGNIVRIYSLPEKRVVSTKPAQVYARRTMSEHEEVKIGQPVGIPGKYLWNTTPEGFQSICQIDGFSKSSQYVTVSCGRYHGEKILKSKVFPLKLINSSIDVIRN